MTQLNHYTLITGGGRLTDRGEVDDGVVTHLAQCLREDRSDVGADWTVERSTATPDGGGIGFSLYRDGEPVVTCGLALSVSAANVLWPGLLKVARMVGLPVSSKQPPLPWLSVAILPAMAAVPPDRLMEIGDLERCLAWALIESGLVVIPRGAGD